VEEERRKRRRVEEEKEGEEIDKICLPCKLPFSIHSKCKSSCVL
jgi:hypothetical protein